MGINSGIAILLRTGDFFHDADLVHQIIMQASLTKLMLTFSDATHFLLFISRLAELADATCEGTPDDDISKVELLHFLLRS